MSTLFDVEQYTIAPERFELDDLLKLVTAPPNIQQANRPDFGKVEALAAIVGVSAQTVHRVKKIGLNFDQADRWASALGYHGWEVWGEDWWGSARNEDWWIECG